MLLLLELEAAHPELMSSYSPSLRVGGRPLDAFESVVHEIPMLSLDNAFDDGELESFYRRMTDRIFAVQHIAFVVSRNWIAWRSVYYTKMVF